MMIKHLRILTKMLGRLGIKCMIRENYSWTSYQLDLKRGGLSHVPQPHRNAPDRWMYGLGLKEAKDCVEGYLARKGRSTTT